jgi:hypothetical protein
MKGLIVEINISEYRRGKSKMDNPEKQWLIPGTTFYNILPNVVCRLGEYSSNAVHSTFNENKSINNFKKEFGYKAGIYAV